VVKFTELSLSGWRQFDQIAIDLHPRLTVLTGANGSGKSTLLGIFSKHFGYQRPFLATPQQSETGVRSYVQGLFARLKDWVKPDAGASAWIGAIAYDKGLARLFVPAQGSVSYDLGIENAQCVSGFHVSSHRSQYTYQQVGQVPTAAITPSQAFSSYDGQVRSEFLQGRWDTPPAFQLKQALISMAMFGEGNKHVRGNVELKNAYEGFVRKLTELLPNEIGFLGIDIRLPDVVLRTRSGEFLLDASSGGLMSLIDIAWRIYMYSLEFDEFVVTMDEPENHLHPSMQRALLPSLVKAFPGVQFIIATHSPFMVSSVRDSNVYVLRHESRDGMVELHSGAQLPTERGVVTIKLDTANKAGDASVILREVLGLPTTLPDWVAEDIQQIAVRYSKQPFTTEMLGELRKELNRLGMAEFYPDVVAKVTPP
jgi:hypothetical protein